MIHHHDNNANDNTKTTGNIYVISAPSGAGKSSLVAALCKKDSSVQLSISHTTRKIRPGEIEGINYFFISVSKFKEMLANGEFLEYANVYGNYYGTNINTIKNFLNSGRDIILEIDYQGAMQIRHIFPNAKLIFITPPSLAELENRLRARNTDDEDTIQKRINSATEDMMHQDKFDHIIINNNFNTALDELYSIIMANREKTLIENLHSS